MVLTLLPAVAFAETEAVVTEEVSDYDTFKAALNGDAQIVKLTGDVEFVGNIARDVKIDLNGKKLTGNISITDGATVTVVDNGAGTIDTDVVTAHGGKLVIESAGKMAEKLEAFVSNTSKIMPADAGYLKIAVASKAEIPYQVGDQTFVRWADAIKAGTVINVIQNVTNFNEEVTKSVTIVVADGVKFNAPTLNVATGVTVTFSAGKVAFANLAGAGKVVAGEAVGASVVMNQTVAPAGATAENFLINGGFYEFDATAFLATGLTQINNLIVNDVADYVAYVGVKGYSLAELDTAVAQAAASGTPIILVKSLDRVITIPVGYAVTIELNGCTVTSVIQNEGTLEITDELNANVGTAEQIINNGNLTLSGGFIVRVENHSKTSKTTLDGAKLSIFDNYSTAAGSFLVKTGSVSEAIANVYTAREYFYQNAGFDAVVAGYASVIKYAAFVGDTGYLTADVKAAIEAITDAKTVTLYETVDGVIINGNVTFDIKAGALKNVTIAAGKTLTLPYGNETYTYGEGLYETIAKPVCYVVVNGANVYYTSLQAAIDAVVPGTKTTITMMDNVTGKGIEIDEAIEVVIDFGTYTYTINELVGVNKTIGLRIHNNEAVVTLKNGTLTIAEDAVNGGASGSGENYLINNFGKALTVTDVNLVGSKGTSIVVCNNFGEVLFNGNTSVSSQYENYMGVVAQNWTTYGGLDIKAGVAVTIDTTGTIGGDLVLDTDAGENTVASFILKNGTFTGAFKALSDAPAKFAISGGTYTELTYEEFYGYIGENIAHINEDGSLTINNENVYEAQFGDVKYLTVAAAVAVATHKGQVIILTDLADLTVEVATDITVQLVVGEYTITNLTKTGVGELKLMSGTVAGTLTVNEGLVTAYTYATFVLDTIVVAEGAELTITTGKWYVSAEKDILAYVPAKYNVVSNVDEEEVVFYTLEATEPMVAIVDGEGAQLVRVDTLDNAINMVLDAESDYFGLTIEIIKKADYYVDLANGKSVTILNPVEATITVAYAGELETVTIAEGNVYTGYTAVACVYIASEKYSFKTVAEAVEYADGDQDAMVHLYAEVDGAFEVENFVDIDNVTYGVGAYDGLEDYDATIGDIRYATINDAVSAAATGATIVVVRDCTNNVINVEGKKVTVTAGNKTAQFNLGNVEITGKGEIVFQYAQIEKLTSTSGATCDASTLGYVAEVVWENGSIAVRGNAGKVTVKNATFKASHSAVIAELNLEGNIKFIAVSAFTVKVLTLNEVVFAEGSAVEIGNFYGLTNETLAALNPIVKTGYVLNKTVDKSGVVYHEVVNAADFVAIVDGYYFTDIDKAVEFANGEEVVTLIVAQTIVLPNNKTVVIAADSVELATVVTANSSYYLDVVEAEAATTYVSKFIMAQVGDKYYASVNDAIADGNTVIQIFDKDTFKVESGFVMLWTSAANVLEVYGVGEHATFTEMTVVALATKTYKFADLQTAADFIATQEKAYEILTVTGDQKATFTAGDVTFYFNGEAVVDLTIDGANVVLVSGNFTGDVAEASVNGIATSVNGDVTSVYSAVYQINAAKPNNITALDDLDGLEIYVDTVLNAPTHTLVKNLKILGDAELTVYGMIDFYTEGFEIADTAKLLIADTEVYFDADIYTGKANVLAAIEGTEADMWLFDAAEESGYYADWYALTESAVGFNNKGYANLDKALTAAKKESGVIILYADQTFTKTTTLTNVDIYLNGYTLTVVDVTVKGDVSIANGTVAVNVAASQKSYAIKVDTGATLELNDVTVQAGGYFDNYTGKKVAVQLENGATLTGNNIDLVNETAKTGGINVFADPSKASNAAILNVSGNIDFANYIFYKFSNKASLDCINHSMTEAHACAYCGEKAVKIVLSTGATVVGEVAEEDGSYWFFDGEYITLKHGTVEAGKHFARWAITGGASIINADVDKNQLLVVAGETNYAYVAAVFESNNEVTVQISAPYFNVTGLTSAQIGNVVITPSAGAKITVTYSDPTNGIFGDILYWINDNGAIIGTSNVLEYTVPANGGTITAICSSAVAGNDITVVFQNGTAKIGTKVLNYAKYTTADLANLYVPALPALGTQKVLGWSIDGTTELVNPDGIVAAIEAAVKADKTEIVFVPAIAVPENVKVEIAVEGETVDTVEVNPTVFSVITTDYEVEGKVFSHWVVNDVEVHADELVYKFTVDTTVEAVFVDADLGISRNPIVELFYDANAQRVIFEGVYQLPEGYTITDAGIVYTTEDLDEDALVANGDGVKTKHVSGLGSSNAITYTLTLNFKNGAKAIKAKAFVACTDADGNVFIFYSDVVETMQ